MKLLAQVADLDDEAAFRLADIENRARKDVSDIERARNYAAALAPALLVTLQPSARQWKDTTFLSGNNQESTSPNGPQG